jgi:hypothetical protein
MVYCIYLKSTVGGVSVALYKVVLKGQFQGQAINNILYYRNGVGVDISGITLGGAKEVADAVKAIVWPALKGVMSTQYQLAQIDSYVYNDQTFDLLYQNPYTEGVQEYGTNVGTGFNGPAPCAILKFILENHAVLVDGPRPPKRGYLAIGPLADNQISDDGTLNLGQGFNLLWDAVCAVMANNVETILPVPGLFFPVRVHMDKIGIGLKLKITSFTDVQAAVMRRVCSFRRSRQPES